MSHFHYLRGIHTHAEMVANSEIKDEGQRVKWGRGKRSLHALDPWTNDKPHGYQKSWKKSRRSQYRANGIRTDKNCHEIFITGWFNNWDIEQYFKKNNIPYKIITKGYWSRHIEGYLIIWWWPKDIGVEYLLRKTT